MCLDKYKDPSKGTYGNIMKEPGTFEGKQYQEKKKTKSKPDKKKKNNKNKDKDKDKKEKLTPEEKRDKLIKRQNQLMKDQKRAQKTTNKALRQEEKVERKALRKSLIQERLDETRHQKNKPKGGHIPVDPFTGTMAGEIGNRKKLNTHSGFTRLVRRK